MSAGRWRLGVDIGTSFTTAAIEVNGEVELLEIDHSRYLPSTVYMDFEGTLLVGRPALGEAAQFPDRAERLPKRALVRSSQVRLGGVTVLPVDLVAVILRKVAAHATRQMGSAPGRLLLTHPAGWTQPQLDLLGEAATRADLPAPELVPEPIGAAVWYANATPVTEGAHVAVYDLGGGTFDTAVLRRTGAGFELAGPPGGDPNFGGEDLDEILMEVLAGHAQAIDPGPWAELWAAADRRARRDLSQLRRDVTEAKESLSDRTTCYVYVPGYDQELRLTRGELEAAAQDPIQATLAELRTTVGRAGLAVADLAGVFLAGGASRMPCVSDLLTQALGVMAAAHGDPKTVVVLGAMTARRQPAARGGPVQVVAPDIIGFGDVLPESHSTPTTEPVREPEAAMELAGPHTSPSARPRPARPVHAQVVHTLRQAGFAWAVSFSPDGRWLATGGYFHAHVWDVATGVCQLKLAPTGWAKLVPERVSAAFSRDSRWVASSGVDGRAWIWDTASGKELVTLRHPRGEFSGALHMVESVAFSPDGRWLTTGGDDGTARIWDVASARELVKVSHDSQVKGVAFSPDGRCLATASNDKTARIWDVASGRELVRVSHESGVKGVAFSLDGRCLATASNDKTARIWDVASGRELIKVNHDDEVGGVAFSPDGRWLATASNDTTARIWDADSGRELVKLYELDAEGHVAHASVKAVAFSPDGYWLATGSTEAKATIWALTEIGGEG